MERAQNRMEISIECIKFKDCHNMNRFCLLKQIRPSLNRIGYMIFHSSCISCTNAKPKRTRNPIL